MLPYQIFQAKWVSPLEEDYALNLQENKLDSLVYDALDSGLEEKPDLADNQPKSGNQVISQTWGRRNKHLYKCS